MKKTLIIATLLLSLVSQGQEGTDFWHRPFWNNITIGAEFCHSPVYKYSFPKGILRNHPNNSVDIKVSYELNHFFTLSAFVGGYGSELGMEDVNGDEYWNETYPDMYQPYWGHASVAQLYNYIYFSFGLEGSFHILPLLYSQKTPFDLTFDIRVGRRPQDLDYGVGLGIGYTLPIGITLYGKVFEGSFCFPLGAQENASRQQLVFGASYRL